MTVPVLPESAPFTAAQRGWLNGFFAGVFGLNQTAAKHVESNGVHRFEPGIAPSTNGHTAVQIEKEEVFPWHDPGLTLEERLKLADGKPHEQMLMAAMGQLNCGSCGYICQTYAEAIARGEDSDLTKCSPGGKDTTRKLKELVAKRKSLPTLSTNGHSGGNGHAKVAGLNGKHHGPSTAPSTPDSVQHDRKNPFPAALLKCAPLTQPGSEKDVRFVSYNLRGSGLTYEVGDAVGVYPENCPEIVEAILDGLGARGDELVATPDGRTVYSYEALLRDYGITKINESIVVLLARAASSKSESGALQAVIENDSDGILESWDLLDLLQYFPSARPPVADLIATLSPLQPRLYSISSSLKAHPDEVHLTVGVVRYQHRDRLRKGVASTYMAELLAPRQREGLCSACAWVSLAGRWRQADHHGRSRHGHRSVSSVPPGAPAATSAKGKNWLFFGDQRRDHDFLYRNELTGYLERRVLSRLDTAFSRDQAEKVYVQHCMLEHGLELWSWLKDGADFYVCGDARRMALDVDRALHTIISEHGKMPADEANEFVRQLTRDKRYQRDVY